MLVLGRAIAGLEQLALCPRHRQARNGHSLASEGIRLFSTWRVQHGKPGRPAISLEVRTLIRRMSRENPGWGAPRIHGELLKHGVDIANIITEWNQRVEYRQGTTLRRRYEREATTLKSSFEFPVHTGSGYRSYGVSGALPSSLSSPTPHSLASEGISVVLDVESPTQQARAPSHITRGPRTDPPHEPRESRLGERGAFTANS